MNQLADDRAVAVLADSAPGRVAARALAITLAAWTNSRTRRMLVVPDEGSRFWWTVAITAVTVALVGGRLGLTS